MDTASVLDQYVQDLSNIPNEIAHILEEIRDKDLKFYETRKRIQQRDNQIHKFIRTHGSLRPNPKEAQAYPKIRADFEKAIQLQDEKCELASTSLYLVAKHYKRLQNEIEKLEDTGLLAPADEFSGSLASRLLLPTSGATGSRMGAGNLGGAGGVSSAGQINNQGTVAGSTGRQLPGSTGAAAAGHIINATSNMKRSASATFGGSGGGTHAGAATTGSRKDSSPMAGGSGPNSRAGTPGPAGGSPGKASSGRPTKRQKTSSALANSTTSMGITTANTVSGSGVGIGGSGLKYETTSPGFANTASGASALANTATAASTTATGKGRGKAGKQTHNTNAGFGKVGSTPINHIHESPVGESGGVAVNAGDEDEIYCFCRQVSFGDMIGCDNENCKYEWFHYGCVGLKEPPQGIWYCPACTKTMKEKETKKDKKKK